MVSHIKPSQQPSPRKPELRRIRRFAQSHSPYKPGFKAGCVNGVLGLVESLWGRPVPDDLLGPQVAPTMSLQVIGTPSTGSKVVLWAESRLPRQTWSISESGHICSQMFEGRILDVKGKLSMCVGQGPCRQQSPQLSLTISPSLTPSPRWPGLRPGPRSAVGAGQGQGIPDLDCPCALNLPPPPSPGGAPWDEMFL